MIFIIPLIKIKTIKGEIKIKLFQPSSHFSVPVLFIKTNCRWIENMTYCKKAFTVEDRM